MPKLHLPSTKFLPKLPQIVANEENAHLLLLTLTALNLLLLVTTFFLLFGQPLRELFPRLVSVSSKTPLVRFSLISPQSGASVSGTVPLVTTLSNGPKIQSAQLYVDDALIQAVTSQKTEKLTLFWDTTRHADGEHQILIEVNDDRQMISTLSTSFTVQNTIKR